MEFVEFNEVNFRVAENQPEYGTIPVKWDPEKREMTALLELSENEVAHLTHISNKLKFTFLLGDAKHFQPLRIELTNPEKPLPEPITMRKLREKLESYFDPALLLWDDDDWDRVATNLYYWLQGDKNPLKPENTNETPG